MMKIIKLSSIFLLVINLINPTLAENNLFKEGKIKYNQKKI